MVTFALLFRPSTTRWRSVFALGNVKNQFPVLAQGASDLFHWLDSGTRGLATPFIEELAGIGKRQATGRCLCIIRRLLVSEDLLQNP